MNLIILGAGGYGRTVADLAKQSGRYSDIKFLDDHSMKEQVIGKCSEYADHLSPDTELYPAFGNNEVRLQWINQLEAAGATVPTLIHSTAYISPEATVDRGAVVLPNAILNTGAIVKRGCIINCGAIVDHDCVIEDGVHVCLGAIIKADNHIPKCKKIESGIVIENNSYPLKGDLQA